MFVLGVSNCIGLVGVGIVAGYFSIIGAVFCTHPKFNYVMGCIVIGCWATSCALCALLAFNRGLEVLSFKATYALFKGSRTYFWISLAVFYGLLFFWLSKPLLFTSNAYAHVFNPFAGMDGDIMDHVLTDKYTHTAHTVNNIAVFIVFSLSFCIITIGIFIKTKVFKGDRELHMTRYQRLTLIQSTILCLLSGATAILQVYMQFFETPKWLIVCMQLSFQLCNGCGGFVYLFFHKRLRSAVFRHVFRLDMKENTYNNGGRSYTQR
uniref:7TM_GPCR_Srx domain-containing protein n=1 Tax=Panagrellus redivivus TaxID=6233 RepID=A0A7E4UM27_PANRE